MKKELFFSEYFGVDPSVLKEYGAFDISLVVDLPLFIDPFLLFHSKKKKYQKLHEEIIEYVLFLKEKAKDKQDKGALEALYQFKEVKQNWLGFSHIGNKGSGLGRDFARSLNETLRIHQKFGKEEITQSSHIEKFCLLGERVGRDHISDLAVNLIKEFLLKYTEKFTLEHIDEKLRADFTVQRVRFNYETEAWESDTFTLPKFNDDFVLLTPRDILTKDDTWINKKDLIESFKDIQNAVSNEALRFSVNNYLKKCIEERTANGDNTKKSDRSEAIHQVIHKFPELIDYYIKHKEESGDQAESISNERVVLSEVLLESVKKIITELNKKGFYTSNKNNKKTSREEAKEKITILKECIENNDAHNLLHGKGKYIKTEKDLQLMFVLVCHRSSDFDINREVNNGRGAVDFTFSKGSADKTLVEFKLAKSTKLEQNLKNQLQIYQKANRTSSAFMVIFYFTGKELERVNDILQKLKMEDSDSVVLIDARNDNKPSASVA